MTVRNAETHRLNSGQLFFDIKIELELLLKE